MVLSPWRFSQTLSLHDAASILSGVVELSPFEMQSEDWATYNRWTDVLTEAVKNCQLGTKKIIAHVRRVDPPLHMSDNPLQEGQGYCLAPAGITESLQVVEDENFLRMAEEGCDIQSLEITLERDVVYQWLKNQGASDGEIPGELLGNDAQRPGPEERAKPLIDTSPLKVASALSDATEDLRALEVLGLFMEAYAHRGPGFRNGDRPSQSAIAQELMRHVPEDVSKMGDRKIKGVLSEAWKAWEEKKRR